MQQEVRFAGHNTNDTILTRLRAAADSLGLPEEAAHVIVDRIARRSSRSRPTTTSTSSCPMYVREHPFPSARRRHALSASRSTRSTRSWTGIARATWRGGSQRGRRRLHERRVRSAASRATSTCLLGARRARRRARRRREQRRVRAAAQGPDAAGAQRRPSAAMCSRRWRWSMPSSCSSRTRRSS